MGQMADEATADTLHTELCAAIADLAKSVEVAVTRMALRARCTTAIADAATAERAAELLRAAAVHSTEAQEQEEPALVPLVMMPHRQHSWEGDAYDCDAVDRLYGACRWLAAAQAPGVARLAEAHREESKIAMRVLELQERFGGLIREK